jgi:hypothetical protein
MSLRRRVSKHILMHHSITRCAMALSTAAPGKATRSVATPYDRRHTQYVRLDPRQVPSAMGTSFPHQRLWQSFVIPRPQVPRSREERANLDYVSLPKLHSMTRRGQRPRKCFDTHHICKSLVEHSGKLRTSSTFLSRNMLCATRTQSRVHLHTQVTNLPDKIDTMTPPSTSIMAGNFHRAHRRRDSTTWLTSGHRHIIPR